MGQVVLRMLAGLSGAVLFGSAAGCSSHPQAPAAHVASPTATRMSAGSTLDPSAQAALASYQASWNAVDQAGSTANYRLPALAEYFHGQAYLLVSQNIFLYQKNGMVSRGAVVLHPRIVSEDFAAKPPTVTIADCVDDRHDLVYYSATGKPIDDEPGGFRADSTVMTDLNGAWKATSLNVGAEGTCTPE